MAPPPASIPIPDELLEEIFIRLPALDALACSSAACTSFRRVIKGRAFRRRVRALHRPPLLGFMDGDGFCPAQDPHPSAPLAGALASCPADFSSVPPVVSSYYVPPGVQDDYEGPRWRPRDVRGGRVLLDWISPRPRVSFLTDSGWLDGFYDFAFLDPLAWGKRERCNAPDFHLAVCNPSSRRYVLLPTIPEELAAQPEDLLYEFQPVLAPATEDDGEELFKVICIARYQTKLVLFVLPSTTMQWCMVESPVFPSLEDMSCFDCVRDCFYWTHPWSWGHHLMVLDTRTLSFSTVYFLTGYHLQLTDTDLSFDRRRRNAVVEGREGAIEMFSLVCQHGSFALHHTSLQDNSDEWNLEKVIQLPGQYQNYSISTVGAAEGFLFFQGYLLDTGFENVDCYLMEVKSYEITKICTKMEYFFERKLALPYFSFPPVLSEPTI